MSNALPAVPPTASLVQTLPTPVPDSTAAPLKVKLIGVPLDLGAGSRGANLGPAALRVAGIKRHLREMGLVVVDAGDVPVRFEEDAFTVEEAQNARHLHEIAETCTHLAETVQRTLTEGYFPLVLGGDHSVAIGTLSGVASWCRSQGKTLGVLWIDAHADINTPETSPSGNVHGMPIAVAMGQGPVELTRIGGDFPKVDPKALAMIGIRSVDEGEKAAIRQHGIYYASMSDLDRWGAHEIITEVIETVMKDVDVLHVSFDVDSLDPALAPGTGTPVEGGLDYREAHLIMEELAECGKLVSMEVLEVNPLLDRANNTAQEAVRLVASALGQRII